MQRTTRKAIVLLLLTLPVFLLLAYFGMISMAPESSRGELGPVILDTAGQGYTHGDVVWLSPGSDFSDDDVVLYDWMKVNPMGMGPTYAIQRFGDLTDEQRRHVLARICCKLGHDRSRATELKGRVY